MPNFKKCLWFLIPKDTQVYNLIKKLQAQYFTDTSDITSTFEPHITIEYNMTNEYECVTRWRKIIENGINIHLKTDINEGGRGDFYSLELNVSVVNNSRENVIQTGYTPHVSFAYKNKPFTLKDKMIARKIINNFQLNDNSIKPVLATQYCDSKEMPWFGNIV
tara:strand:- start:1843 stop:2331 length:489 start_codon:yes stop_codon:yes gene_type:complete